MPRMKLLLNLGTADARRLGLEGDDAREGAIVDVSGDVAESLLKHGWATQDVEGKAPDIPAPEPNAAAAADARLEGRPDAVRAAEEKGKGEGEAKPAPAPAPAPAERHPNRQGR